MHGEIYNVGGKPDTYVLAINCIETVRDFVTMSFQSTGIDLNWQGKAESEVGVNKVIGKIFVKLNSKFYRSAEVELLIGDSSKAKRDLDWKPKITFEQSCKMMVEVEKH